MISEKKIYVYLSNSIIAWPSCKSRLPIAAETGSYKNTLMPSSSENATITAFGTAGCVCSVSESGCIAQRAKEEGAIEDDSLDGGVAVGMTAPTRSFTFARWALLVMMAVVATSTPVAWWILNAARDPSCGRRRWYVPWRSWRQRWKRRKVYSVRWKHWRVHKTGRVNAPLSFNVASHVVGGNCELYPMPANFTQTGLSISLSTQSTFSSLISRWAMLRSWKYWVATEKFWVIRTLSFSLIKDPSGWCRCIRKSPLAANSIPTCAVSFERSRNKSYVRTKCA